MFLDVVVWPTILVYSLFFLIILGVIAGSVVALVFIIRKKKQTDKAKDAPLEEKGEDFNG